MIFRCGVVLTREVYSANIAAWDCSDSARSTVIELDGGHNTGHRVVG
jgi:hypothetical protein